MDTTNRYLPTVAGPDTILGNPDNTNVGAVSMKGMMVPLLVCLMTGMVMGQQPSNPADSDQEPIGRFLLDMSDDHIDNLIQFGSLRAEIPQNIRNDINQVEIRYVNAIETGLLPGQIVQVPSTDPKALQFEIDDDQLAILKRRGLRYTIRDLDLGKYNVVIIDYKSAPGFIGPRNQPKSINANYENNLANRTSGSSSRLDKDAFDRKPLTTPRNETRRTDSNILADNGFGNFGADRRTSNHSPLAPSTGNSSTTESDFDRWARQQREKRQAERLAAQQKEADRLAAEQLAADKLAAQNRTRQMQEQWRNRDPNNQVGSTLQEVRPVDLQRLRDKMALEDQQRKQQEIDNLKFQADQLKRQRLAKQQQNAQDEIDRELRLKQLQDEIDREEALRRRYAMRNADDYPYVYREGRPWIDERTNRFPERRAKDYQYELDEDPDYDRLARNATHVSRKPSSDGPAPFSINGPEARVANNSNNSNTPGTAQPTTGNVVLADQTQLTRLNQQNKLLWFMLLCSLGLNVYLGWIARSFYGRYEELADELRETFTSTV